MKFESYFVSCLEKVQCRPDFEPEIPLPQTPGVIAVHHVAQGENYACQLMLKSDINMHLVFSADAPEGVEITFREVGLVPCDMPALPGDDDVLFPHAGLHPDPLLPIEKPMRLTFNNWHAVYIDFKVSADCKPGRYAIPFTIESVYTPGCPWGIPFDIVKKEKVILNVHKAELQPQKLICTNWFHCDCLAYYYGVEIWSDEFWSIAADFWRDMTAHGRNMLYTPLWTPPLDTAVGAERPTCQLLKITYKNGRYSFDFSLLEKFIALAQACGVEYFEMSHIFTQWGAKATPKIVAETENGMEKIFGWHVESNSVKYEEFLSALLPELAKFFEAHKLAGKVYFHLSDEPPLASIGTYRKGAEIVYRYLSRKDYPVLDALSNIDFFHQDLLDVPVPAVREFHLFDREKTRERWFYYAGMSNGYTTSSYGVASRRNRIIGVLCYLYRIEGFLHWGHNFWFGQYSLHYDLDPWRETTADRAFTGGGSFNVYPGKDRKPVDSLHYEIFTLALNDLRLLRTLEAKIGREETVKLVHAGLDYEITMNRYPRDAAYLENLHTAVLKKLDE